MIEDHFNNGYGTYILYLDGIRFCEIDLRSKSYLRGCFDQIIVSDTQTAAKDRHRKLIETSGAGFIESNLDG